MLTGQRVTLRPVRDDDLPLIYEWRMDLATWLQGDHNPPRPQGFPEFRELYDRISRDHLNTEWAIEAGGELVGRLGQFNYDPLSRNTEVGITVGPAYRGKGYASDALRVMARYCFSLRNLHRVYLETLATNEPGLNCYRAVGFVEEGRRREHAWIDGEYVDVVVMGLLRPEWLAAHG